MNPSSLDKKKPEEVELEKKLVELIDLEAERSAKEFEFLMLQLNLASFDLRWSTDITHRESILDGTKSQLAALEAEYVAVKEKLNVKPELRQLFVSRNENKTEAKVDGQDTYRRAKPEPQDAAEDFEDDDDQDSVREDYEDESSIKKKTDTGVKTQYRTLAKTIHPDLATCEEERSHRETLMKDLNDAYSRNDLNKIVEVSVAWEESVWAIQIPGSVGELVRVIRKIANIREKMKQIDIDLEELRIGTDYKLWRQIEDLAANGVDWWQERIDEIEDEIAENEEALSKIKRKIQRLKQETTFKSMRIGTAEVTSATRIVQGSTTYLKCLVVGGKLIQGSIIRVHRNDKVILNANIEAIKWQNCVVTEVFEGNQCALCIPNYSPAIDDLIECFQMQKTPLAE